MTLRRAQSRSAPQYGARPSLPGKTMASEPEMSPTCEFYLRTRWEPLNKNLKLKLGLNNFHSYDDNTNYDDKDINGENHDDDSVNNDRICGVDAQGEKKK
ncbi:hypothetical protein RRG08_065801 [Elysia crispata]|uniref:Uncharacterized protein n=1 Tax=Elysia crispata TaxID=231223 RepID=A0AAE0ZRQ5_9GAST|nr:hypothetical protein RRG08_065801 [Elysia crispata]